MNQFSTNEDWKPGHWAGFFFYKTVLQTSLLSCSVQSQMTKWSFPFSEMQRSIGHKWASQMLGSKETLQNIVSNCFVWIYVYTDIFFANPDLNVQVHSSGLQEHIYGYLVQSVCSCLFRHFNVWRGGSCQRSLAPHFGLEGVAYILNPTLWLNWLGATNMGYNTIHAKCFHYKSILT